MIDNWINERYLNENTVDNIRQSAIAKPISRYVVLDDFFNTDAIDHLISYHVNLNFSDENDRVVGNKILPYDSSVVFATKNHQGADLFFDPEWYRYCAYLVGSAHKTKETEIKLRYHKPMADGFWIHTDSSTRSIVIIAYFTKNWEVKDGGLLQLWRLAEDMSPEALEVNNPKGRLSCLKSNRIKTRTPGGDFADGLPHDLILYDQIVPVYNRVFIADLKHDPMYHSVTPSNGKIRYGFVQWLL